MSKIRLTKTELKLQKEDLSRFQRYLPMLQLKKKQLQAEIIKVQQAIAEITEEIRRLKGETTYWVSVFGEEFPFREFLSLESVKTETENIAGVSIPVFLEAEFKEKEYDLLTSPLWVDKAFSVIKAVLNQEAKLGVYRKQLEILSEEFRIATQRVNLFEKVKIPAAKENIRLIQIYLGELQTAEVVRGKIAKAKIAAKKAEISV